MANTIIPTLRTLRRVQLNITLGYLNEDPLAGLCDELEEISGMNKLESIEIQIKVPLGEKCRTGDEWGRLEKVLLRSGWPMLKRVSLAIFIFHSKRHGPFEKALKRLQTQFSSLTSSKNCDFHFSVHNWNNDNDGSHLPLNQIIFRNP